MTSCGSAQGVQRTGSFPAGVSMRSPSADLESRQGFNDQTTRHARRLYVGNLPSDTNEHEIAEFFNNAMTISKASESGSTPVLSVYLNLDKRFAFIEVHTVAEAAAALCMDGLLFRGMSLRMRRPNDFSASRPGADAKPPAQFSAAALGIVSTQVRDSPNKMFIGGIPYHLSEDQIKELLQSYGALKAFNLIKDSSTGLSKGYAFFEYADCSVMDSAIQGFNGMRVGDKILTVRRATAAGAARSDLQHQQLQTQQQHYKQHAPQISPLRGGGIDAGGPGTSSAQVVTAGVSGAGAVGGAAVSELGVGGAAGDVAREGEGVAVNDGLIGAGAVESAVGAGVGAGPEGRVALLTRKVTRVLELRNMLKREELMDDEEYEEIVEDVREEAGKHGALREVYIPRPPKGAESGQEEPAGVGRVFLAFEETSAAEKAFVVLSGRKFDGRPVIATYLEEDKYERREF